MKNMADTGKRKNRRHNMKQNIEHNVKHNMKRKLLILLLAICVLTAFMPTCAFAGENDTVTVKTFDALQTALSNSNVKTIIIPTDTNIVIPFDDCDTTGNADGTTSNAGSGFSWISGSGYETPYKTLTVKNGTTLDIQGTLVLGGVTSFPYQENAQGHTSGAYSKIENNGTIVVKKEFDVYGLISGSGTVEVKRDATLKEVMIINDFQGGTITEEWYESGQFPFNEYALVNIQSNVKLNAGAIVKGVSSLWCATSSGGSDVKTRRIEASLVGPSSSLLKISSGSVMTSYSGTPRSNETIGGIDLSTVGTKTINISGNTTIGSLSVAGEGVNYPSSGKYFGIPYNYDIIFSSGTHELIDSYRLMPGSKVTVSNGATLNVKGKLVKYDSLSPKTKNGKRYALDGAANLAIYGTMNIASGATFVGNATGTGTVTAKSGANLTLKDTYGVVSSDSYGGSDVIAQTITGKFNGIQIVPSDGTPAIGGPAGPAAPQEEKVNVVIYKSKNDSTPLYTYSVKKGEGISVPNTPKKDYDDNYHYTFSRWYDSTTGSTASFAEFDKDTVIWAEYIEEAHALVDGTCTVCGYNNEKYQKEQLEKTAKNAKITAGVKNTKLSKKSIVKTGKKIKISWTKSNGYAVDYYEVFKSTKKGSFSSTPYYVTTSGTKTTYANSKGLKKGKTYYYKVRGVRIIDGQKVYTKTVTMSQKYK